MKRFKGFTLVELLISIALLGVIISITSAVFSVALRSYRLNIQKSFFQKDMNFALDSIANNAKSASLITASKNGYASSQNTVILAIPAKDQSGNFVYTADVLEYDYYIYYLSNGSLHKKIYGNPNGSLSGQNNTDTTIMENVTNFSVTYSPDMANAQGITVILGVGRSVGNHDVSLSQQRSVNLRNKQ